MIEKAILQNFQAHKNTTLNLSEGVNVIKGTSAQGKTSIVRALRWVLTNRPQGFAFKSYFATDKDTTRTTLIFTDKSFVTRERNNKNNEYFDENAIVYKALRGEVPGEIQEIANMDDVNLLSQHDPYFMLQDTPGERGRRINAIVNLEIIDETLGKCVSIIRSTRSIISEREENIEQYKSQLEGFKHVEACEILVYDIDELSIVKANTENQRGDIVSLLGMLGDSREFIKTQKHWLKVKPAYEEVKKLIEEQKQLKGQTDKLAQLHRLVVMSKDKLEKDKHWLKVKPAYEELIPLLPKSKDISYKYMRISDLIQRIATAKKVQNSAFQTCKTKQDLYDKTLKDNGICPLCKRLM